MRDEDDAPNVPVPPLKPPPSDLAESIAETTPPPGAATDRDQPLMTAAQGEEIKTLLLGLRQDFRAEVDHARKESVERDKRLMDLLLQYHSEQRDDFNVKLDGQAQRFKVELEAAGALLLGGINGNSEAIRELAGKLEAAIDRAADKVLTETNGKLGIIADRTEGLAHVIGEAGITREMAKKGYDNSLNALRNQGQDVVDEFDRPTVVEIKPR